MINEIRKIILLVFLLVPYNLIAESEIKDKNLVCTHNSGKDIYFFIIDFEGEDTTVIEGDTHSPFVSEKKYVAGYNVDFIFIAKDRTTLTLFPSYKVDRKTLEVFKYEEGTFNFDPIYHKCEAGNVDMKKNLFQSQNVDNWVDYIKEVRKIVIQKKKSQNKI